MSSYRRYVAQHSAAVHRALKQVRSHALETPPDPVTVAWTRDTFRGFAERLRGHSFTLEVSPMRMDAARIILGQDPVLAYRGRSTSRLWCADCVRGLPMDLTSLIPLTSDELPEGGICGTCGVDVLIPVAPVTTAECPECSHSHSSGTTCARAYGNVVCGCTA